MKLHSEHVADLTAELLNTRDLCGNEWQCIREYLTDNGFPPRGSVGGDIVVSAALRNLEIAWNEARREAGVKNV